MAELIRFCAAALLALLLGSAATAQQLGDFGRVAPGFVNDSVLPAFDSVGKTLTRQPRSTFNWTDEEAEMHDRVWRFLVAPHAADWAFEYGAEIKRVKLSDKKARKIDRYFKWLNTTRFASSHTRYTRLSDDIGADILTLPSTFRAICVVQGIDRQRAIAAENIDDIEPEMIRQQQLRDLENRAYIDRFVLALNYRYLSYDYALNHLLVETPYAAAIEVNDRLNQLAPLVDLALNDDFCSAEFGFGGDEIVAIRPRVLMDAPSEGEYRK